MKKIKLESTINLVVLCAIIACCFFACSKSAPTPASPQDQAKALLTAAPWKLQSSSVDGVDQTALYNGFVITFSSSGYAASNGGVIWPAAGTWSFQGTSTTAISRNDGLAVGIQLTSTSLVMTLNWTATTLGGGRSESTKGNNVFTMTH